MRALLVCALGVLPLAWRAGGVSPRSSTPPPAVCCSGGSRPRLAKEDLDAAIRQAMKTWGAPGVAVVVVHDDRVVYLQGHGVAEAGQKAAVTPDTVFALSSNTKGLTSALIARLVEEGLLSWDDPVRDHLPWFRMEDALIEREVTLRDLLCHRTGMGAHELLWRHAPWAIDEAVKRTGKLPLDHDFRTQVRYQSALAAAAGLAAGAAAKSSWSDLVQKKLLDPLDMKATFLTTAAAMKSGRLATGHRLDRANEPAPLPTYRFAQADPACSAYASARDLGKWLRFQLSEGVGPDGKRLVAAAYLRETHAPQMVIHLSELQSALWPASTYHAYALGWVTYDHLGRRHVAHGGAIDGFRTHLVMVPEEKLGVAVLANLDQTFLPVPLAHTLLDLVLNHPKRDWHALYRAMLRRLEADRAAARRERLARRKHGTAPTRELAAHAGTYEHPAYGSARMALRGGRLVWSWRNEEAVLDHFHYNTFTASGELIGEAEITFTLDAAGAVNELTITGGLNVTFGRAVAGRKQP